MLTQRKTGNTAINESIDPGKQGWLKEVRVHLSAAGGAGNLTVTLDSIAGSTYDTVLMSQDMTSVTDLVWQPDVPVHFDNGDKLVIAWANGSGRTYGFELKYN